jgi:hypothetical protein
MTLSQQVPSLGIVFIIKLKFRLATFNGSFPYEVHKIFTTNGRATMIVEALQSRNVRISLRSTKSCASFIQSLSVCCLGIILLLINGAKIDRAALVRSESRRQGEETRQSV